ncbi:MAG: S8/S53 family peptidase, partial [Clostridia bacterium]
MSKLWRKLSKILLVTLLFLLAFSATFINFPLENEISYAVVPENYQAYVKNNNHDWQDSADYLKLENAKKIVKSWAGDKAYDFSSLIDKPIVVAVIDTGIRFDHEIFAGKYDKDGKPIKSDVSVGNYDVIFRQNREIVCRNTVSNKTDLNVCSKIEDLADDHCQQHGTHVAGIIATLIHEFDLEEYIKIMPIKASNPAGTFYPADFKQAVEFAVLKGADVVNMSLGDGKNPSFAIPDNLVNKAVFVAAAGNNGYNSSSSAFYPAATPNVIGVMNYQKGSPLSLYSGSNSGSNYGDKYDICAPGTGIYNANGESKIGYKPMTGTSMASPMVAFAGALLTLKYRALEKTTGFEIKPDNARKMLIAEPSKIITKGNYKFPTLELDTVVATDFLNDARFADTINQSPETLKILPDKKLEFEQDRTEDITFDVKISPKDYVEGLTVNWFEVVGGNKTLIGSGKKLV